PAPGGPRGPPPGISDFRVDGSMAEAGATSAREITARAVAARPWTGRLSAWLAQERVFRLIPFVMVEATFLFLLAVPFALTVYISLLKWRANRPFEMAYFHGLLNYKRILTEPELWWSLGRTFYFAGVAVTLELLLGFFLAMLVHKEFRGRKLYITVFLTPMMVVPVVVGYNFSMIYVDYGPLSQLMAPFLEPFGINPRIRWLSHPAAAQWAIILADVWQWTSLTFLIFLSGFSALPQQLINAARVMGASRWQILWRVQLPLLKPVIIIAVVIRTMEALKLFDQAVLLTFGGPGNSTQTIAFFLWRQVWQFNKYSFGAAASVLLLILFSVLIYFGIYLLVRERALVQQEGR
ncbi:MAG: carbohydrate ABC transporter permease, partial [Nitrospinota bacterium]